MRVNLISTAATYPATDSLARLASVLLRRGDHVRVHLPRPIADLPQPLPDLIAHEGASSPDLLALPRFRTSDLFVYHCVDFDPILETLHGLERGVVVLWPQPFVALDSPHALPDYLVRLASASDLVVIDDAPSARALQDAGAAEPRRLRVVPPAVSLAHFAPVPPDAALSRDLGLLGKRVLLTMPPACATDDLDSAQSLLAAVRAQLDNAALAVVLPPASPAQLESIATGDHTILLPPVDDLRPFYGIADLLLASSRCAESGQRALEARACGTPVLSLDSREDDLTQTVLELLTDDAAYSAAVRSSLNMATDHSLEAFAQSWGAVIAKACDWLPVRLTPDCAASGASDSPVQPAGEIKSERMPTDLLSIDIEQLRTMAAVTLRDYEVRSPTPFFGPFIAWVRRNLTSHLRKPYLDPTFDRQEAFNLRAANTLEDLARTLAAYRRALARQQTQPYSPRPSTVDPQVIKLITEVENLVDTLAVDDATSAQADVIRRALAQIRYLLHEPSGPTAPSAQD